MNSRFQNFSGLILAGRRKTRIKSVFKLYSSAGKEKAHSLAQKLLDVDEFERVAALLRVAEAQNDDEWLSSFNRWLALKNEDAVNLRQTAGGRFFRLTAPTDCLSRRGEVTNGPKVTVIMTAHNSANTLRMAANSILNQSWQNIELILVDDASFDQTASIIDDLAKQDARVVPLYNKVNIGTFPSKNLALLQCTGEYVTCHDSDDWAFPRRIERQMNHLNGSNVGSIGDYVRLNVNGQLTRAQQIGKISADGICQFANISLLLKKSVQLERIGFWDSLKFAADREYVDRSKIILRQDLKVTRDLTMLCLVHDNNLSVSLSKSNGWIRKNIATRYYYRWAFKRWHAKYSSMENCHKLRLDFPLVNRPFEVPEKMKLALQSHDYIAEVAGRMGKDKSE